jgi:hypothetical protein
MEKAKQDTGLHITFFVFKFAVCKLKSPSFLKYCLFKGENLSKLSVMVIDLSKKNWDDGRSVEVFKGCSSCSCIIA